MGNKNRARPESQTVSGHIILLYPLPFSGIMSKKTILSLALPYFHLNFKEPFQWSSGYEMPIYFDGKSFLSLPENRSAVLESIKKNTQSDAEFLPENFQTIAATTMGGLVPGASLAGELNKPFAFFYHRDLYRFTPGAVEKVISGYAQYSKKNFDLVISTAPFGILPGVHLADKLNLPFAYVRREKKMHGTQNKIEGLHGLPVVESGQKPKAIFIDWYEGKSYGAKAVQEVEEYGVEVMEYKDLEIPLQGKGKLGRTLHLEDVVSFGGGSLRDIHKERIYGATIEHCLAVFTYGFAETLGRFSQEDCSLSSLLQFQEVLALSSWTGEEKEKLKVWHEKPKLKKWI